METPGKGGGIVYSLVARGNVVLAEYSAASGNFPSIARRILDRISLSTDTKMSYSYDRHVFHYTVSHGLVYLCMTEESLGRKLPFVYLEAIEADFVPMHGKDVTGAQPFEFNVTFSPVLKAKTVYYNTHPDVDAVRKVKGQVEEVKQVMVQNIEKVLERGEKIELLVDRTDTLNQNAFTFRKKARQVKRQMWWRNVRCNLLIAVVVGCVLFFAAAISCGGFTFPKCKSKGDDKDKKNAVTSPSPTVIPPEPSQGHQSPVASAVARVASNMGGNVHVDSSFSGSDSISSSTSGSSGSSSGSSSFSSSSSSSSSGSSFSGSDSFSGSGTSEVFSTNKRKKD